MAWPLWLTTLTLLQFKFAGTRSTSRHCSATISTTTSSTSTTTKESAGSGFTAEAVRNSSSESDRELLDQVTLKAKIWPVSLQSRFKPPSHPPHWFPFQIHIIWFDLCLANLEFARLLTFRAELFLSDFLRQVRTRNAVREKLLSLLHILRRCTLHQWCLV